MSACWDRVARTSGELWRWLEECRLGFTRPVAARVLGYDSGDAHDESLRGRNLPPFTLLRDWVYVVLLLEREERGSPPSTGGFGAGTGTPRCTTGLSRG